MRMLMSFLEKAIELEADFLGHRLQGWAGT
jgi:hypothetical protein